MDYKPAVWTVKLAVSYTSHPLTVVYTCVTQICTDRYQRCSMQV